MPNRISYKKAVNFLFNQLPMYSKIGMEAYKPGLENIISLCNHLGNPQNNFKSIHIAGTNGKGSISHMLASLLQTEGYKTGLYTSPHLKKFNERIKINGIEISDEYVANFISINYDFIVKLNASFFEVTTAMAFQYFSEQKIEIAVIETGLGGRLDSTNIIYPILSIITNIGWDHMDLLGETLEKIAFEKAGIIKKNTPVIISEHQKEIEKVFFEKCLAENAPLYFTDDIQIINKSYSHNLHKISLKVNNEDSSLDLALDLLGNYQEKNIKGLIKAVEILNLVGLKISDTSLKNGLKRVQKNTKLKGRWQILSKQPLLICDSSHNISGIKEIFNQITLIKYEKLHLIFGLTNEKNITQILKILPQNANFYFSEASNKRAMRAETILIEADKLNLSSQIIKDVNMAIKKATEMATPNDLILVFGSIYLLSEIKNL